MKSLIIEATPDGINFMQRNESGHYQHQKLIGYKTAIKSLDAGGYDQDLYNGLRVIATIYEGEAQGYFMLNDEQRMLLWRWIVATLFINDQIEKNGTTSVINSDGSTEVAVVYKGKNGWMCIYPMAERIALANNIETVAFEICRDNPEVYATQMYQMFVTLKNGTYAISETGLHGLSIIHDDFIDILQTEGMPSMPVTH